jgi:protein transport protein SEC61 subunit gamma-like protein
MFDILGFIKQCNRVWYILRKPSKKEFTTIAKVSVIGLGLIGLIGFVISLLMKFVQI